MILGHGLHGSFGDLLGCILVGLKWCFVNILRKMNLAHILDPIGEHAEIRGRRSIIFEMLQGQHTMSVMVGRCCHLQLRLLLLLETSAAIIVNAQGAVFLKTVTLVNQNHAAHHPIIRFSRQLKILQKLHA